jgi:hypothetical protein
MTTGPTDPRLPPAESADRRAASHRSRATLDAVFGDVLPGTTRDDLDDNEPGSAPARSSTHGAAEARRDDELRRNVPPHHR